MSEDKQEIKANKPLLEEYFGYDGDVKRANLLKRIATRVKLRKAGLDD